MSFCIENCVSSCVSEKTVLVIFGLKRNTSSFLLWKESTVTLLCLLLIGVVPPNVFTSEFCLRNNAGILFYPSSLSFGQNMHSA